MTEGNRFDKYYAGDSAGAADGNSPTERFSLEEHFESEQMTLSGSATAQSARARHIRISGSAHIADEVVAETLHCSGSIHAGGNISASTVDISGSLESGGSIRSRSFALSGSCRSARLIRAEDFISSSGSIAAVELQAGNRITVSGSVRAERLRADRVEIMGGGRAGGISCTDAEINSRGKGRRLFSLFRKADLRIESIEAGGRVDIDECSVGEITASSVHVGKSCAVGKIRYRDNCSVETGAEVGETIKL